MSLVASSSSQPSSRGEAAAGRARGGGPALAYPVADPRDWERYGRLGPLARLQLALRNRRFGRRARRDASVAPASRSGIRPLGAGEIALVCVVRNGLRYLPDFACHYRRLGVDRFLVLDDRSDDGTAEWLLGQPDVDLFRSGLRYAQSEWGRLWRDRLVELHGGDRWYVGVDVDETLVFPGSETRSLRDFIRDLERCGQRRSMAPMIDIYPEGSLCGVAEDWPQGGAAQARDVFFDGDGYEARADKFCLSLRGGPRRRLLGFDNRLTKFPLVFADAWTGEAGASVHGPRPLARNFEAPTAVLLHDKFHKGAVEEWRQLVEENQHFGDGMYYRPLLERAATGDLDLRYEGSVRYVSSDDLVRRGFMRDIRPR
ncbi:glycosyltransferase family 2 protein [Aureimonas sp. AU4]|uniref:glycosyltransferase family 2 protein n=1 Tax=Aureimonas sp. AU4 TaxID=1638163 RepID=UPI000B00B1F8|nr:glycosyltransferase family 2 protein [Aureimonas sp. AU4]